MEVRYITKDEAVDYLKVSSASFIWKFDEKVDTSVNIPVLAAFHEGKLIAGVEMYDYKCNFCGNFLPSVIVSGVCSIPEYRRMGGVRAIFDAIGNKAFEYNHILGFLHPFSISYYEKFGYANLNRLYGIKIPFDNLNHIPRNTDMILYTGEQFEELSSLHKECAKKENLATLRDDKKHFCDKPLENTDYTYFRRNSEGIADGYVRFTVSRPDVLKVEDLFVLSPEALYGIIGFLRNYDCIAKNLIVRKQYPHSPMSVLADRIPGVIYEHESGTAARIYDVKAILENNIYPEEKGHFSLMIKDNLPRNNGIFEVSYQNKKAEVIKKESGSFDICLTPPSASKLMLAGEGHNQETALFIDGVTLNGNADDFFRAFPCRTTRFTDSIWSD